MTEKEKTYRTKKREVCCMRCCPEKLMGNPVLQKILDKGSADGGRNKTIGISFDDTTAAA